MSTKQSTGDPRIRLFWDKYLTRMHKKGVKPPFDRWFVKRAEEYIGSSEKRLAQQNPADVEAFLRETGRKPNLKSWQFRQIVDAIQNLFEQVNIDWVGSFDWGFWRDSARLLDCSHPTVARSYAAIDSPTAEVDDRNAHKVSFAEIRRRHADLINSVRTSARRRGLAIKTEQTYEHWILRYIAFHSNSDPHSLGPADVAAFLDYLALRRNVSGSTQNIALNALVFLFRNVLWREDIDFDEFAKEQRY